MEFESLYPDLDVETSEHTGKNIDMFLNGYKLGSFRHKLSEHDLRVCYKGWFVRNEALEATTSITGTSLDKKIFALNLGSELPTNINKNIRIGLAVHNAIKKEVTRLQEQKEVTALHIKQILKELNSFNNAIKYEFLDEEAEKIHSIYASINKHDFREVSKFLRYLLTQGERDNIPNAYKYAIVTSSCLISECFGLTSPIGMAKYLRNAEGKYEDAVLGTNPMLWMNYILSNIGNSAGEHYNKSILIESTFNALTRKDDSKRETSKIHAIIKFLFSHPVCEVTLIRDTFDLSTPGINKIIDKMVSNGILTKIGNSKRNSKYECQSLLSI